jgi:hypothetical protein
MFRIDILQSQWIWGALLMGTLIVLGMALAYMAFWRVPAPAEKKRLPVALMLTYVAVIVFAVVYTVAKILYPPNW